MTKLPGISGSLRAPSFNTALLCAAQVAAVDGFGTFLSQNHWLPVLRALGVCHWSGGRLMVSRAAAVFAGDGHLQDPAIRRQRAEFIEGFAASVEASARSRKAVN